MPLLDARRYTLYAKQGFTLIELLVVITILGILASLTLATFGGTQERSRDSRRKTDLDAIKKALELAKQDLTGSYYYPICTAGATCNIATGATLNPDLSRPTSTTPYIQKVPVDPKSNTGYSYSTYSDRTNSTACSTLNICISYKLVACLENTNDSQKDTTTDSACTSTTNASYTVKP